MSDQEKQEVSTPNAATQGPVIGIADLQNAVKIIDYACSNGAFRGWEVIEQVIAVREKIAAFLASAVPTAQPEQPVTPSEEVVTPVKTKAKAKVVPAIKPVAAKVTTKKK